MRFIDLSVPINAQTPVYPGDLATRIESAGIFEKDGYEDHYICMGTHVGTHVDAPSHMIAGGINLDQIPMERFFGRGVCIKAGRELNLEAAKGVNIQEDDIVLFHTGMSSRYHESEYYDNYPAMTEELAHYLVERRVKMVGVDMCSVDHEPFPVHRILLKQQILIIENLTNLSALEGKEFTVYAFPIKLQIDGAPVRVVVELSS